MNPLVLSNVSAQLLDEQAVLSLEEFCRACAASDQAILELVQEGVLAPLDEVSLSFSGSQLRRARVALRLQRDLDVNLAGVALVLQLLEDVDALQLRLAQRG